MPWQGHKILKKDTLIKLSFKIPNKNFGHQGLYIYTMVHTHTYEYALGTIL